MDVDATRFPRLSAHLKALPSGLESHPGCKARGSLLRTFAQGLDAEKVRAAGLPAALEAALLTPPLATEWVNEVLSWAGILAASDLLGLHGEAWAKWAHERNLELHSSPAMRAAMTFTSPNLALSLGSAYWGLLHQGSHLQALDCHKTGGQVELTYPEALFGEAAARSMCVSFAVVLELARARHPAVRLEQWTPARAVFGARWS